MLACTSLGGLWSAGRRTPVNVAVVLDCLQVDGFLSEAHRPLSSRHGSVELRLFIALWTVCQAMTASDPL
jgi:hypothetical protein